MDWILYVFRKGFKHYLVPSDSYDNAWESLSKRQSMRLELCKKEYTFKGTMDGNSKIWKL
jgi:hypothetical protein